MSNTPQIYQNKSILVLCTTTIPPVPTPPNIWTLSVWGCCSGCNLIATLYLVQHAVCLWLRDGSNLDSLPRLNHFQGEVGPSLSEVTTGEVAVVRAGVLWRRCRRRAGSKSGCRLACLLRWSDRINRFWQTGQTKFFSPVWVLVCLANSSLRANLLRQEAHVHSKGLSPVCVLRCAFKCEDLP